MERAARPGPLPERRTEPGHCTLRNLLERHAVANRESVWNGRLISLIVPADPPEVLDGKVVPLIAAHEGKHRGQCVMGIVSKQPIHQRGWLDATHAHLHMLD